MALQRASRPADHPSPGPVLQVQDLVAGYYPDIHVLRGVFLEAWPGRVTCILGPNGTGKSTLLKTIYGFLRPARGEIRYLGRRLTAVVSHRMAALGIAYLPQRPSIFPYLSVAVNLELGTWPLAVGRAGVRQALARARQRLPLLQELWRRPAGQLSGGQQRQVEMARTLLIDARLLLVDEPTAGVEPRTADAIYELLAQLAHRDGKAVVLVDQNIRKALEIADDVYVLSAGRVLDHGPRSRFGDDVDALVVRWLAPQDAPPEPFGRR